jgi:predicted nucleic acid-binding protein
MASLIDSNIIIYSYLDEYQRLRKLIIDESASISEISRIEVLGYHRLTADEEKYFLDIFNFVAIVIPSKEIFDKAIELRKLYNLKLGDSLIASTAIIHSLTLYTRNLIDFEKVKGLSCINPLI